MFFWNEASHLRRDTLRINALPVIPAKAGIQLDISRLSRKFWIPAYAGMTTSLSRLKREAWNDLPANAMAAKTPIQRSWEMLSLSIHAR